MYSPVVRTSSIGVVSSNFVACTWSRRPNFMRKEDFLFVERVLRPFRWAKALLSLEPSKQQTRYCKLLPLPGISNGSLIHIQNTGPIPTWWLKKDASYLNRPSRSSRTSAAMWITWRRRGSMMQVKKWHLKKCLRHNFYGILKKITELFYFILYSAFCAEIMAKA